MNFFIGPNNSGKSIVLNLISEQLREIQTNSKIKGLRDAEIHSARESGTLSIAIGETCDAICSRLVSGLQYPTFQYVGKILTELSVNGMIWAKYTQNGHREILPSVNLAEARNWIENRLWYEAWTSLTQRTGGGIDTWICQTITRIAQEVQTRPTKIHLIPAKREIGISGQIFDDLSGKGLIDHLAELQTPNFDKQAHRERFQHINRFLQEVTGKSKARLQVPHSRQHLLVHIDNKVLPLSSLGTGVHETILIAAFCTIHDRRIMCIEEPEIHLHPLLQKKMIKFLIENTNSQYFIATHSAAFIDTPDASIFSVSNDGEQTRINHVSSKVAGRDLLNDLGYQASDLLQSNMIIWAEGPSDRIYLKHWIKTVDDELTEGIHYTIMFYGGSLIRHLSASDEALSDFIKLNDLNRNIAIIIDSDRDTASSTLKPHAQRLRDEISAGKGLVWITEGREMENYIDGTTLQSALKDHHPNLFVAEGKTGPYDHAFYFFRNDADKPQQKKTFKDADKVGVAVRICEETARLNILDLELRLDELTQMVRRANGLGLKRLA